MLRLSRPAMGTARLLRRQLRALKAQERHLKQTKRQMAEASEAGPKAQAGVPPALDFLPENTELEAAMAVMLSQQHDARSRLAVMRQFLSAMVLSIASPVGPWDPLDLKPQTFALGKYLALPVFTSLPYLQAFCRAFHFVVRGPDGELWADPTPAPDALLPPPLQHAPQASEEAEDMARQAGHRRNFWESVAGVERFDFRTAMPLPTWGPLRLPYMYGYYADFDTLVENASIVPDSVDIVLNPATPMELVVARHTASTLLRRDMLLHKGYAAVARQVCGEFARFFLAHCPEVLRGTTATLPHLKPQTTRHEESEFDIVLVIESDDFDATMQRCAWGKANGWLVGHASLQLLPSGSEPAHVTGCAQQFYHRGLATSTSQGGGGLQRVGGSALVNTEVAADNYYSDPELGYLEPHAVWPPRQGR